MKVIPTEFNGVKYRSRTEARWAVFMHYVKLEFVYEPEGFDLGKDGWYIPDFYLPELDTFLEIKPDFIIEGRESPVFALAKHTKKRVITLKGQPKFKDFDDEGYDVAYPVGGDHEYLFCCCTRCRRVGIEYGGRSERINCKCFPDHYGKIYNYESPLLIAGYRAAQNAFRF